MTHVATASVKHGPPRVWPRGRIEERTRGPQRPAPFALLFESRCGYVLVRPCPADIADHEGLPSGELNRPFEPARGEKPS